MPKIQNSFKIKEKEEHSLCFEFSYEVQKIQEAIIEGKEIPREKRERRIPARLLS